MRIEYKIEKISSRERINAARQLDPKEKNKIRFFLIRDKNGKKYFNEKKKNKIGKDFLKNKKKYPKNIIQLIESCAVYSKRKNSEPTMPEFFKYFLLGASVISFLIPTIKSSEECVRQEQIKQVIIDYKENRKDLENKIKEIAEEEIKMNKQFCINMPFKKNKVTSGFGRRINPFSKQTGGPKTDRHYGWDVIPLDSDKRIGALQSGSVVFSGWKKGYGRTIIIEHENGFKTLYAHLYKTNVVLGDFIKIGDIIGLVGSSGRSRGPHLHFEVINEKGKKLNPRRFVKSYIKALEWDCWQEKVESAKSTLLDIDKKMLKVGYDSTINYINKSNLISLLQRK
jgi:hypothetical protein